jgi:hypothetical protein
LAKANPLPVYYIQVSSPQNIIYFSSDVPLSFTQASYAKLNLTSFSYSLDGQANVPITGNTTLTGLTYGLHKIVVYGQDTNGETYTSDTVHFSVWFHTLWTTTEVALLAVSSTSLVVCYKKRRQISEAMKRKDSNKFWKGVIAFGFATFFLLATILFYLDYAYFTTHHGLTVNATFLFIPFWIIFIALGLYWIKTSFRHEKPQESLAP